MPYKWIEAEGGEPRQELHLWPHQSLRPGGFVLFIGVTVLMILLPLMHVVGTAVLWGVLPFMALAVGGMWFAIHRSRQAAQILEILTLTDTRAHLARHNPAGNVQEWDCNRYWVQPQMHTTGGPVPFYVTLRGGGREVEIGAFLSEDERIALYDELTRTLRSPAA